MRTVIAFLIAPIIPIIVLITYSVVPYTLAVNLPPIKAIVTTFVVGLLLSYFLILVMAVPLFLILGKLRIFSPTITIISAAIIASMLVIIPDVYSIITSNPDSKFSFSARGCQIIVDNVRTRCGYVLLFQNIAEFALGGALSGLIFWLVYRRGGGSGR